MESERIELIVHKFSSWYRVLYFAIDHEAKLINYDGGIIGPGFMVFKVAAEKSDSFEKELRAKFGNEISVCRPDFRFDNYQTASRL